MDRRTQERLWGVIGTGEQLEGGNDSVITGIVGDQRHCIVQLVRCWQRMRRTILVHNGGMGVRNKSVRQSVSLPASVAAQVRSMAKSRRLSANRMLVELIEHGMEAEKRKQQQFFELAERFRRTTNEEEAKQLGDELGRMVFGG